MYEVVRVLSKLVGALGIDKIYYTPRKGSKLMSLCLDNFDNLPVSKTVFLVEDAHPTDKSGVKLPGFSFQQTYPINNSNFESIIYEIYKQIFESLISDNNPNPKSLLVRYKKGTIAKQNQD